VNVTLTIVLAEICLALTAVIVVIGVKALGRYRRDKAAVNTLVTSIKTNQSARVEKLAGILKEGAQLSESDALGKANELIKKQNKFYQDAIDLYFTRNHEVLSKLDNRMEELLSQYQGMFAGSGGEGAPMDNAAMEELSKGIATLSKEIEELRDENANLTSQLKAAEHELDQLGQEYVSAFNKPKENKKPKEATVTGDDAETAEGPEVDAGETGDESQAINSLEDAREPETDAGTATEATTEAEAEVEAEAETEVEEKPEVMTEADAEPGTEAEPTATASEDETQQSNAPEPEPEEKPTDDKSADANALSTADDAEEDQGLLTDLDLAELLGDQPGQPAADDKSSDNK